MLERLQPANERLHKFVNRVLRRKVDPESTPEQYIEDKTVRTIMNLLASLYAPILLAGSLAILSCVESELARIAVLGALGILLTMSIMLVVPTVKRSDLFAITAAFFAVGGVYIGSKSFDYRQVGL